METAGGKNCDVLSAVWGWIFLGDGEKETEERGSERESERELIEYRRRFSKSVEKHCEIRKGWFCGVHDVLFSDEV